MKNFFVIFLTLIILSGCSKNEPVKVAGIPEKAFWVGGKCGGQWYLIDEINEENGTIRCKIYNDRFGHQLIDREFVLDSYNNAVKKIDFNNLKELITGTDWGFKEDDSDVIIHLKGHCCFRINS